MKIEAKKCRHCGTWADERAKQIVAAAASAASPPAEPPSYVVASVVAFLGYFCLWVPGLILNLYFLAAANSVKREIGREPAGLGALRALLIIFVYLPLACVGALAMLLLIGSLIARSLS